MQSNPGAGTPHTGGNDDEVWRDLVARLEETDDAFLAEQEPHADDGTSMTDAQGTLDTPDATNAPETRGVIDFDPLGVWQRQSAPAPREPAHGSHPNDVPVAGEGDSFGPRDYAMDDAEDHFVPEELPSLRNTEPAIMLSWIGAAGGPLFLVFSAIFWRQIPMTFVIGVIVAFIAGTGYLLFRLPNHRDHDSGDGAVV